MAPPPEEPQAPVSGEAAPPPGDSGPPDAAKEVARRIEELTRQIAALTESARREHERAAHREQVIDRLHAENQQLRHGLMQEALTPVRAGLYRLYDTVAREAARWQEPDPPPSELAGRLLSAMADEVAEVLGRTGAEILGVRPGDPYDPAVHRPARTSEVDAGADGTVVEVLAEGFTMGDRVLRKASVVVGRAAGTGDVDQEPDKSTKAPKIPKKPDALEGLRQTTDKKDDKHRSARVLTNATGPDQTNGSTEKESE
jgi:molecular chaperone GrpE (heat shock protein)